MKIIGSNLIEYPVEMVWDSLLDPRVLVATIPGCERLVPTGENAYDMTVTAGVAAIKGTYQGQCTLSDLVEHEGMTMRPSGAGAPGTIHATLPGSFASPAADTTAISYEADAVVGGMVGGVGQRMLTSVSRRMAGEFFGNVGRTLSAPVTAAAGASEQVAVGETPAGAAVFSAPPRSAVSSQGDFAKGIAVGAGLVVL